MRVTDLRFVRPLSSLNRWGEQLVRGPCYLQATILCWSEINRDQNRNQGEASWGGNTEGVETSGEPAQPPSRALALKRERRVPLSPTVTNKSHSSADPSPLL